MSDGIKLARVICALIDEPWLLTPAKHRKLTEIAVAHMNGSHEAADAFRLENERIWQPEMRATKGSSGSRIADNGGIVTDKGVAVLPIEGVIGRKFSMFLNSSGVVSIDVLDEMLRECAARSDVRAVVLQFDSPGGSAAGVEDTAAEIAALNAKKPCIAFADGQCCSAAYWMASQCCAIYGIRSADVGSVGVYMALLDESRAYEMDGYKTELFKAGKLKAMGVPGTSLNDEQRAFLQARVDGLYAKFVANVRGGRAGRTIPDEALQGQSHDAEAAVRNGLMDSVTTRQQAIDDADYLAKMRGL